MVGLSLFSGFSLRFWSKVSKTKSCWNWTSATDEKGYPLFWKDGACRRLAAMLDVPDGLQISHLCKNKQCVKPSHIVFETPRENKRRDPGPGRPRPCPRRHPKSERRYRGGTECAACALERARKKYASDPNFREQAKARTRRNRIAKR